MLYSCDVHLLAAVSLYMWCMCVRGGAMDDGKVET